MMVNLDLQNLTWDVKQAYTWAPLPAGERIAVVYPPGFKRFNEDGEEMYAVLEKNLTACRTLLEDGANTGTTSS